MWIHSQIPYNCVTTPEPVEIVEDGASAVKIEEEKGLVKGEIWMNHKYKELSQASLACPPFSLFFSLSHHQKLMHFKVMSMSLWSL
jgi:hypothetical protein